MDPDPLQYGNPLPFASVYYPLGFPLHLETNSQQVLRAASASWGVYGPMFESEPLRMRVAVEPGGAAPAPPVYRGQDHLMAIVGRASEFGVCDYTRRYAWCRLSEAAAAAPDFTGYFYLEAMAYHLLTQLHVTPVHAACVARAGAGIALCGPAGAGKSSLAYECARRGWTYVSDNESWLLRRSCPPELIGNPARIRFRDTAPQLFPELQHLPVKFHANGKASIHMSTAGMPALSTAVRRPIAAMVFLERRGGQGGLSRVGADEVMAMLMSGVPMYEPGVHREHEASLRAFAGLPAFRMRYDTLECGVELLERVAANS